MSKKTILIAFYAVASMALYSQRPTIELTFTAVDNEAYVQVDSIRIINRTQGGDTVLYWPDTVFSFNYVGLPEVSEGDKTFRFLQSYPNPAADQVTVSLYVPEKNRVSIIVTDILGRMIVESERVLDRGNHSYRFTPSNGNLFFLTASWKGQHSSTRVLHTGSGPARAVKLEYTGSGNYSSQLKAMDGTREFSFSPGDDLLCISYASGIRSGIFDNPEENQTIIFQYATNIPCPGLPMVEYEGQVYNTIQILSQCWLGENLNVGAMVNGAVIQSDNGIIEKYCYNNQADSCSRYGGLYQWAEMMQYTSQQGTRGICPPNWHVPADEEWKVLEGAADSQYGIGDDIWEFYGYRGLDAGTNLKATSGWYENGNGTDLLEFTGLPGGARAPGSFFDFGYYGYWWTSTEIGNYDAWFRFINTFNQQVNRYNLTKVNSYSVRCLKDY